MHLSQAGLHTENSISWVIFCINVPLQATLLRAPSSRECDSEVCSKLLQGFFRVHANGCMQKRLISVKTDGSLCFLPVSLRFWRRSWISKSSFLLCLCFPYLFQACACGTPLRSASLLMCPRQYFFVCSRVSVIFLASSPIFHNISFFVRRKGHL